LLRVLKEDAQIFENKNILWTNEKAKILLEGFFD